MKALGLNQTTLAARMKVARPYITKVLQNAPEKRACVSEGTRIATRCARRGRQDARDVSITFRTAARFAKALQMDFMPTLAPRNEEK